ncbi:MAG: 2-oxoacid:acceptor oxidoreductase family protein [Oscillospiraceae bacterium]|nr:2-oxoacid:acceptor oxidoreductase family protein [Oscillospiraceae bacterium]
MNTNILIAGFGGQGILFAGRLLVYAGMLSDQEISWLPSYGPEMRGGTANCSVIMGDSPVGSPVVDKPDVLIAMNLPSLDKFEPAVVPGGHMFIDSALIARPAARDDVVCHYVPATRIADENGVPGLANMVMLGSVVAVLGFVPEGVLSQAMKKVIPERKIEMFGRNMKALTIGLHGDYEGG